MKLQDILRTHAVVIGFAASLLLAGGSRAQEIDNTVWADSSNVESFPQATSAVAHDLNTVPTSAYTASAAVITQPGVDAEGVVTDGAEREAWLIGMSLILMAPLGVLVVARARRVKPSKGNTALS
jgi:hypothetical protein